MSETPVDHAAPLVDKHPTPPRSTPSPTALDTAESKLSRKREREVSLELPTPTVNDDPIKRKSSGLPLKKNRRVLEPTEEEEDNAVPTGGSGSRSVSGSPEIRDEDDNPRETKRTSPPHNHMIQSGFMAYASTTSPFASVKGQNIFSSKSPPSIFAAGTTTSQLPTWLAPAFGSSSLTSPPVKRSGFGAFASSSSPFVKHQRGESPKGGFGEAERDSGGEGDEGNQPQSFGEKLRAAKDDEHENTDGEGTSKLTEQDVMTGEEEEETIHQVRGKLFSLQGSSWKERGMGVLRLNVKQDDGTGARLVMRKDAVYTLLLNVTLFPGMRCTLAQDPRYLRFTAIENGAATTYNLKMSDAKVAQDLLEEIRANIPSS